MSPYEVEMVLASDASAKYEVHNATINPKAVPAQLSTKEYEAVHEILGKVVQLVRRVGIKRLEIKQVED